MATTGKVDLKKVRMALNVARKSNDKKLQNMLGRLMGSNQAARSLANHVVHKKGY